MITRCRTRFPDHDWRQADMRDLELGRVFDGLIAWDSFFHLPPVSQRRMFAVFARHARPGAPLLFTSGPRAGEAIGSWQGAPLYHASLDPQDYRTLFAASGFREVAHVAEDPQCGGHSVWLVQADPATP